MERIPASPEEFPPEVTVAFAAKYLGTSERTVINYLKARQLKGQKIGKPWFIDTKSLFQMRSPEKTLREVSLPPVENPNSLNQESRKNRRQDKKKDWELVKSPKRNPLQLNCFSLLKDSTELMADIDDLSSAERELFGSMLNEVGDDLGAGYYSFGPVKRKLYGRARIRAGRLVARAILQKMPGGLIMSFSQLAEAIASLCRAVDRNSQSRASKKSSQTSSPATDSENDFSERRSPCSFGDSDAEKPAAALEF